MVLVVVVAWGWINRWVFGVLTARFVVGFYVISLLCCFVVWGSVLVFLGWLLGVRHTVVCWFWLICLGGFSFGFDRLCTC